jgi:CheY-like chemotaxis protein
MNPGGGPNAQILLVEDDERVRSLVRTALEMNGYRVLEAGSGYEALQLCREHRGEIDLLLMDVVLPGLSGQALATRAAAVCPGIRVLYMSGYPDNTVAQHGVPPELVFVHKPVSLPDLIANVGAVLQ